MQPNTKTVTTAGMTTMKPSIDLVRITKPGRLDEQDRGDDQCPRFSTHHAPDTNSCSNNRIASRYIRRVVEPVNAYLTGTCPSAQSEMIALTPK